MLMKTSLFARLIRRFNPLTARHLSIILAPLAVALVCALSCALFFPGAALASVAVGLAAGAVLGLPVAGYVVRSLNQRITFARAKADLVAGNPPEIAGDDDVERITRRLDQIARRVKDSEDTRSE